VKETVDNLLGFDIGGTKCTVLVGTAEGLVLARREWDSQAERGPRFMIDNLLTEARALLQQCPKIGRAGVSIGGPVDADLGVVHSPPNLPGWDQIPIKAELETSLELPVNVEHDAAACALAEYEWGLNCQPRRLIYLTCATGFGAGMVFDGQPYYGVFGRSPEIGHVLLAEDGPEAFGLKGSAEAFCSARSLSRLATWRFPERWQNPPSPTDIQRLAESGDPEARSIIDLNARMTGRCCALLGDLLHPDHIALGSLARYLGPAWLADVRRAFERLALPTVAEHCSIAATVLAVRLQDLSALAAAKRTTS